MDQIRQARRRRRHELPGLLLRHRTRLDLRAPVPEEVHTFVLDGAVDPTQITTRTRSSSWRGSRTRSASSRSGAAKAPVCADLGDPAQPPSSCSRARCERRSRPGPTASSRLARLHRRPRGAVLESEWPRLANALTQRRTATGPGLLQLADKYNQRSARRHVPEHHRRQHDDQLQRHSGPQTPSVAKILARSKVVAKRFPIFGRYRRLLPARAASAGSRTARPSRRRQRQPRSRARRRQPARPGDALPGGEAPGRRNGQCPAAHLERRGPHVLLATAARASTVT